MSATKDETRLTELYVASESRVEEGDATIRMRTGDVWVGQVKRKYAAEIVTAVNERGRLRAAMQKFVDAYAGGKAAWLGNGQARRSLDEFRQLLNDATPSPSAGEDE